VTDTAHDAPFTEAPVGIGCYAKAAAPTDVSGDADKANLWCLRNGALAIQQSYAGVLATTGNGVSGTGVQRVTIASDSTGLISVNPGTAANFGIYVEDAAETAGGNLMMAGTVRRDTPSTSAGSTAENATLNTDANGNLWTTLNANTTAGLDTLNATSGDGSTSCTSTSQAVKSSGGNLYGWVIHNPNTATEYVVLYNTANASVTVGTTSPKFIIPIPAGATANAFSDLGIQFGTAMALACTTTAAGNGNPSTALEVNLFYK